MITVIRQGLVLGRFLWVIYCPCTRQASTKRAVMQCNVDSGVAIFHHIYQGPSRMQSLWVAMMSCRAFVGISQHLYSAGFLFFFSWSSSSTSNSRLIYIFGMKGGHLSLLFQQETLFGQELFWRGSRRLWPPLSVKSLHPSVLFACDINCQNDTVLYC